jgi:hypothetical protein
MTLGAAWKALRSLAAQMRTWQCRIRNLSKASFVLELSFPLNISSAAITLLE